MAVMEAIKPLSVRRIRKGRKTLPGPSFYFDEKSRVFLEIERALRVPETSGVEVQLNGETIWICDEKGNSETDLLDAIHQEG